MAAYLSSIYFNVKWFFNRRNLILWLIISALLFGYTWGKISDYQLVPVKEAKFKEIQQKKFEAQPSYEYYAIFGVNSMYQSSPASIFFSNTIVPEDVTAKINSQTIFDINSNVVNNNTSPDNLSYEMDASGIIFYFLTLLFLFYGFDSLGDKAYSRLIASTFNNGPISNLTTYLISRCLVLLSGFVILYSGQVLLMNIRGIKMSIGDIEALGGHLLSAVLLLAFIFATGAAIRAIIKSNFWAVIALLASLGTVLYVIPSAVSKLTKNMLPDITKGYTISLDNLNVMFGFEKKSLEAMGPFDRNKIEQERKNIEEFKKEYYPKIKENLLSLKEQIKIAADNHDLLSMLTPGSFYLQTSSEVSSMGYQNLLEFFQMQVNLQEGFTFFYIDRTFYNDPKNLENYIKNDENIYRAKALLPNHYWTGVMSTVIWCIILFSAAVYWASRRLKPKAKSKDEFDEVDISLDYGLHTSLKFSNPDFIFHLMANFDGKSRTLAEKITIGDKKLEGGDKIEYAFIPNPIHLPGEISTATFLSFLKRAAGLSEESMAVITHGIDGDCLKKRLKDVDMETKARILMSYALVCKPKTVILDNISRRLDSYEDIVDIAVKIKEKGKMIIDFIDSSNETWWMDLDRYFTYKYKNKKYVVRSTLPKKTHKKIIAAEY